MYPSRPWYRQISAIALILIIAATTAHTQSRSTIEAGWRFGLTGGLNYNLQALGLQFLDTTKVFNFFPFEGVDGTGIGPYISLFSEYNSQDWWGAQLRLSYDSRNGKSTDNTLPQEKTFDINLTYLTIEPLFRVNPFGPAGLYAVAGPLVGIKLSDGCDFTPSPNEAAQQLVLTDMNPLTFGLSGGLGYDMVIGDRMSDMRWYLAPFVEGSWMVQQRSGSPNILDQDKFDDIWSTVTVRAGVSLKLGIMPPIDELTVTESSDLNLALFAPDRLVAFRRYEEYFPLVTSVFFDNGSTDIPARYVRHNSGEAATFTENDLLDSSKIGRLGATDRMAEQMNVYYNIMNIYGARLRQNPTSTLTLIGSAPGTGDANTMADNVKNYLVSTYGIDAARITVETRDLPRIPSGSARTPVEDRPLTAEENRRVEFVTKPVDLGTPVRIRRVDRNPIENDLVLNINEDAKIKSWQLVVNGEGKRQTYGPFSRASQRVSPAEIMRDLSEGTFTAEVVAITNDGQRISRTKDFKLTKKDEPGKQAHRYSIIFGYGQDDPVRTYETFLKTTVAQQIETGSKVYVLGHTDAIGDSTLNYNLSVKRAGEVRDIIRSETNRLAKKAMYESVGYGEEESPSTFSNRTPEGRFYNRGVTIEVVPED